MTTYSALFPSSNLLFSVPTPRPTLATDSTDFTIAADAVGNVGTAFSFNVPAKGLLIIEPYEFAGRSNTGSGAYAYATWGIRIGGADYLPAGEHDTSGSGFPSNYRVFMNQNGAGYLVQWKAPFVTGWLGGLMPHATILNIERQAIPTGDQTVQMRILNKKSTSIGNTLHVRGASERPTVLGIRSIAWS